jgi:tetratricopeptide (TPR) repeat protein
MPDSIKPQSAGEPDGGPDRETTIESLLVAGLDSYFKGEYDLAIHAWTRVLFLDRSHQRARAYIDRARAILAERQRESDQLLHEALSAFDRGDTVRARELLDQAAARGAQEAQALALRDRLERLEGPLNGPSLAVPAPPPAKRAVAPATRADRPSSSWPTMVACLVAGAILAIAWPRIVDWAAKEVSPPTSGVAMAPDAFLPAPAASELIVERAAYLFGRGHLHEALELLDTVGVGDARRAEADRLRAEIQRVLLAGVEPRASDRRTGRADADGPR